MDGKVPQVGLRKTPRDVVVKYEQSNAGSAKGVKLADGQDPQTQNQEQSVKTDQGQTDGDKTHLARARAVSTDIAEESERGKLGELREVDEVDDAQNGNKQTEGKEKGVPGGAELGERDKVAPGKKKSRKSTEGDTGGSSENDPQQAKAKKKGKKKGEKSRNGGRAREDSDAVKQNEIKPSVLFGKGSSITCHLDTDSAGGRLTFEVDGQDVGVCVSGVFELLGADELFPCVCLAPFDDLDLRESDSVSVQESEGKGESESVEEDEKTEEQVTCVYVCMYVVCICMRVSHEKTEEQVTFVYVCVYVCMCI
jgi:hypothetical protein